MADQVGHDCSTEISLTIATSMKPVTAIKKPDFLAGDGILLRAARFRADFLAAIENNRDFTLSPLYYIPSDHPKLTTDVLKRHAMCEGQRPEDEGVRRCPFFRLCPPEMFPSCLT